MTRSEYLEMLGLSAEASWSDVVEAHAAGIALHNRTLESGTADQKNSANTQIALLNQALEFLQDDPVLQIRDRPYTAQGAFSVGASPAVEQSERRLLIPAFLFLVLNVCLSLILLWFLLRPAPTEIVYRERLVREIQPFIPAPILTPEAESITAEFADTPPSPIPIESFDPDETPEIVGPEPSPNPTPAIVSDNPLSADPEELGIDYKERDRVLVLEGSKEPRQTIKGFTPDIVDASISCNVQVVTRLLDDGVDINTVDTVGDTSLTWAVRRRCLPVVKLLLSRGAEVDARSRNGFTPYVWSRVYRADAIAKVLLEAGADPKIGQYWWRFDEDAERAWLDRALEAACRNQDCRDRRRDK